MNYWNSSFKVKPKVYKARKSTKKQSKAGLWREYGLTRPPKPRYTGRKGIYWYLFSQKVRREDFEQFGTCINCGRKVTTWHDFDAGHFINAARCGFKLLFHRMNVHGECGGCNAYDKQKLGYERGLDSRYGIHTAQKIKDAFFLSKKGAPAKEWSQKEYDEKIRALQRELEALSS